jgi:predicted GNAT family N-acyltransferase
MTVADEIAHFTEQARQMLMRKAINTACAHFEKAGLLLGADELLAAFQASPKFERIKEQVRSEAAAIGVLVYLSEEGRRRREWEQRVEERLGSISQKECE